MEAMYFSCLPLINAPKIRTLLFLHGDIFESANSYNMILLKKVTFTIIYNAL